MCFVNIPDQFQHAALPASIADRSCFFLKTSFVEFRHYGPNMRRIEGRFAARKHTLINPCHGRRTYVSESIKILNQECGIVVRLGPWCGLKQPLLLFLIDIDEQRRKSS
jgi:hypothetical protein